jgi:hypothetical protein
VTTLLTGVLVALVAGVFGIGGAVVQARRTHDRWLREVRLQAYADFLGVVWRVAGMTLHRSRLVSRVAEMMELPLTLTEAEQAASLRATVNERVDTLDELDVAAGRVRLLGPSSIDEPLESVRGHAIQVSVNPNDGQWALSLRSEVDRFIAEARKHVVDL